MKKSINTSLTHLCYSETDMPLSFLLALHRHYDNECFKIIDTDLSEYENSPVNKSDTAIHKPFLNTNQRRNK